MTLHAVLNDAQVEDAICRTRNGDTAAFEGVVRRYETPLRMWLAAHVPPGIDVDDIAQRAFVAAFSRLSDYTPGSRFEAWLFTIARYQLQTEVTRLRRVADYHARYAPDLLQRELQRRSHEPSELLSARLDHLKVCLESIGDHLRRFITWRYDEEIPLEEMASRSGRSVAAVKKQLWKIRQSLQQCMEARMAAAEGGGVVNDQERFAELWTDYLEGDLDESGVAELRELLSADEKYLQLAADMYQTHRMLGFVVEEMPSRQDEFVRAVLSRLPEDSDSFVSGVMADVARVAPPDSPDHRKAPVGPAPWKTALLAVIALSILAIASYPFWPAGRVAVVEETPQESGESTSAVSEVNVRIASMAHARFFGELLPPVKSVLSPRRDYVLMSGMVEIAFPGGASAIIEGPSVFRVMSDECLALDVGRCSVHAPDGGEGFRVDTPVTRVVDRGTRFSVNVAETSETEVQVIEGAADVYDVSRLANPPKNEIRLTNGKARRFANGRVFASDDIPFDSSVYRRGLPDRIISYKATNAADGGGENLISVTVQRNGRVMEIPVENLTPARITAFKTSSPGAFFCGSETLPGQRIATASDRSLVTGAINPGGSVEPLTADPVLTGDEATPGLAIRFDRPVTNGPGADVVFFDLQTFSNPPEGDAFHVSPLHFRDGLKSHTIRVFDLTMESSSARDLTNFYVHVFSGAADSLAKLESLECTPHKQVISFRGLAVGIDLSDLGYAAGESVDGLFFQDALDDKHYVDPVFIGGLPAIE